MAELRADSMVEPRADLLADRWVASRAGTKELRMVGRTVAAKVDLKAEK